MKSQKTGILLFILIFFMGLHISCKRKSTEIIKSNSWKEIIGLKGAQKYIVSGGKLDSVLRFQSLLNMIDVYESNKIISYSNGYDGEDDFKYKMFYSKSIQAVIKGEKLILLNNKSRIGLEYNLKQYDSTFLSRMAPYIYTSNYIVGNNNNTLLFAYNNNRKGNPLTFLMMKFSVSNFGCTLDYTKKIEFDTNTTLRSIHAFSDYFLLNLGNQPNSQRGLYKLTENGDIKLLSSDESGPIFEFNNQIYANKLYRSYGIFSNNNSGSFDSNFSIIDNNGFLDIYCQFKTIQDSLVAFQGDKIFKLKYNNTSSLTKSLMYDIIHYKNDGLENLQINDIEILNNIVYVATSNGIYYKTAQDFFNNK